MLKKLFETMRQICGRSHQGQGAALSREAFDPKRNDKAVV